MERGDDGLRKEESRMKEKSRHEGGIKKKRGGREEEKVEYITEGKEKARSKADRDERCGRKGKAREKKG